MRLSDLNGYCQCGFYGLNLIWQLWLVRKNLTFLCPTIKIKKGHFCKRLMKKGTKNVTSRTYM